MGLGGLLFHSGGLGKPKNMLSILGIEIKFFCRPPVSLVTAPTDWAIQVTFSELVIEFLASIAHGKQRQDLVYPNLP